MRKQAIEDQSEVKDSAAAMTIEIALMKRRTTASMLAPESRSWNRTCRGIPVLLLLVLMCCSVQRGVDAFHTHLHLGAGPQHPLYNSITTSARKPTKLRASERKHSSKKAAKKRAKRPRRFGQTAHKPGSANIQKDRMWKSRKKSIEELEDIMTQRWGTDLSAWTATDVEEADFDERDDRNNGDASGSTTPQFRAKPVKDPWQVADARKKSKVDNDEKTPTTFFRSNAAVNKENMIQNAASDREYYDEDDIGYEAPTTRRRNSDSSLEPHRRRISVDHVITPKPAGGRGSKQVNDYRNDYQKEEDRGGKDGNFFFRDTRPKSENQIGPKNDVAERTTSRQQKQKIPKPLKDKQGKPLLLTLEQAKRNYKDSLVEAAATEVQSTGDEEEKGRVEASTADSPSWEELGITDSQLLDNLEAMGCTQPLSVQAKTCSEIVHGDEDVVVGTYTGSGKTLAFLVPLAQKILSETRHEGDQGSSSSSKGVKAVIIAPGRELASQIVSVARELFQDTGLSVMMAIGGTTFNRNLQQIRKRKPDFIVGTPGRIAELIVGRPGERTGRLLKTMGRNEKLVLDEFDALLEYKPHREPTTAILRSLKQRYGDRMQSVFCSATASDMLLAPKDRLSRYLRPGFVQIMADSDDLLVTGMGDKGQQSVTRVSQTVIHGVVPVPHRRLALETLRRVLHTDPIPQQILIFVHDAHKVDLVVEKLSAMGIVAAALHGGRNSEKMDRAEVSKALREGYVGIVVATELAARGLDAPLLTHVINFDLPTDASFYAHRAGRVGRCGRPGVVLNFTTDPKERKVPQKFATKLGIEMHQIDVRSGKLNIVDPSWQQPTPK